MTGDNFDGRIAELRHRNEARLSRKEPEGASIRAAVGRAYQVGVELVVAIGICTTGGWLIDRWLDSRPAAMIVLFLIGAAAGTRNIMRSAAEMGLSADPSASQSGSAAGTENGSGPHDKKR